MIDLSLDSHQPFRVFVAASTEGGPIANKLRKYLQAELRRRGKVEAWFHKFSVGATAIESLETVAREADFAVIVMTPDDVTVSRQKEMLSPRDNLVFELGLFIGALGRDRSFVARGAKAKMKLPTDLLGITDLLFDASTPKNLAASLKERCAILAKQMVGAGLRPKWLTEGMASLAANAGFGRQVEGAWWERIHHPTGTSLSFFMIHADPLTGGVSFVGEGFGKKGERTARWHTEMTRLYPGDRRIAYLWRGKHLSGSVNLEFHGYGTMEFKQPPHPDAPMTLGGGDFWDVNEAEPTKTVMKPIDLRRADTQQQRTMLAGAAKEKARLVRETIEAW